MSDRRKLEVETDANAIDLDTDPSQELDAAMEEALKAIEQGPRQEDRQEEQKEDRETAASQASEDPAVAGDEADALRKEVARERERALRALADLENYRKRVQRERQDESRFKAFEPMRQFLAVVDNLERALASAGSVDDLKEGVAMILRQMGNLLRDHGVERIEALGQSFDPGLHEAVSGEEDAQLAVPTVIDELQSGYKMHDRLLRPSVVKVAMPRAQTGNGDEDDA
jgi:molecular chaperone GrpE